jgi:hypothetical protein
MFEPDVNDITLAQVLKCMETTSDPMMEHACKQFLTYVMEQEEKRREEKERGDDSL